MVFHWCLYNKQNITCPLMDMNFIFSWSTRYLTRSLRSLVRYRVDHSKIKFISTRGHVISSIHQTHYEKSDWSRSFNQFTIACELDMINAISAADITFIMSSSTSAWLLSPLKCSPQTSIFIIHDIMLNLIQ